MKKPSIKFTVVKEDTGYSANGMVGDVFIVTEADNFESLNLMILEAVNLTFEDEGYDYSREEIKFTYDLESFFEFYRVINAKALSERIGMNQSLLSQYIKGIKKPSPSQTKRILHGVQQIGRELSDVSFLL
ncbi:MAG: helix-turn-helix transcriptional regulator [Saprospiraceae bacterium]